MSNKEKKEKTKKQVRIMTVEIEEYYEKIGKDVYHIWRFSAEKNWRKELTPYKEIPFAEIKGILR